MLKVICRLFDDMADQIKDHIAIKTPAHAITFGELKDASQIIAHHLRDKAGQKSIVGLMMPSGIEYVSVVLGVNRSGNAFLPIDNKLPQKRKSAICAHADPSVIITDPASLPLLQQMSYPGIVLVVKYDGGNLGVFQLQDNALTALASPGKMQPPISEGQPDEKGNAYLIYTSGSTGEPKAIAGRNDSLCHFIQWQVQHFELTGIRSGMITSIGFDVSLRDIFTPLLAGGTLIIPGSEVLGNIPAMLDWIRTEGVELLHVVPSIFRLLTIEANSEKLATLKYVFLAGEPLYWKDVRTWYDHAAGVGAKLVNLYGPSETTLAKVFFEIPTTPPHNVEDSQIVPLGTPLPETKILLLSGNKPCDDGEQGEIYIYTDYPSNGYFNNAALNQEKFTEIDFNNRRYLFYKTGDLGYIEGGLLKFVARMDRQVKISGNRVELAEVEGVLLGHQGIANAVVLIDSKDVQNPSLIAFYTCSSPVEPGHIARYIRGVLPDYMCPHFIYDLPQFPLNVNNKVDVSKLMELHRARQSQQLKQFVAHGAGSMLDQCIGIIVSVTGATNVHPEKTLMELGISSLKAIRIISEVYKRYKVNVPVPFILSNPLYKIAELIAGQQKELGAPALNSMTQQRMHRLSPQQEQMLYVSKYSKEANLAYNVLLTYRVTGALDIRKVKAFINAVAEKYRIFRTSYELGGSSYRQKINPFVPVSVEELDMPQEDIQSYLTQLKNEEFDLSRDTLLLKMKVIKVASKEHYLIFITHHITVDVWSLQILARDFASFYSTGRLYNTEASVLQYDDFSEWYNKMIAEESGRRSRDFWTKMFQTKSDFLFPLDYERPKRRSFIGKMETLALDNEVSERLFSYVQEKGITLFMLCLSAIGILLRRYAGQNPIIGTPISLRDLGQTYNDSVGYFLNMMPVKYPANDDQSFDEHILNWKEILLDLYEHKHYPFSYLVNELPYKYRANQNPLFDHMVVEVDDLPETALVDAAAGNPEEPLSFKQINNGNRYNKFDLTFFIIRGESKLKFAIEYDLELYREETVRFLLQQLTSLLGQIVSNPFAPLGHYALEPYLFGKQDNSVDLSNESADDHAIALTQLASTPALFPNECKLRDLWKKILKTDRDISLEDDFFAIGGNSIKALLLIAEINKAYGKAIVLIDLFEHSTLKKLSAFLFERDLHSDAQNIPAVGWAKSYALSAAQSRMWAISQMGKANVAYNIPRVFVFEGSFNPASLERALKALVDRHEILRTVFRDDERGEVAQVILSTAELEILLAYRECAPAAMGQSTLKEEVNSAFATPFDLEKGPLFRAYLWRVSDSKWVFAFCIHHIISDGWSIDILIRELMQFYKEFTFGAKADLPPLKTQYKDYAAWQGRQLKGEKLKSLKEYWLAQFSGELPVLDLPGDRPRPTVKTYNGASHTAVLPAEIARDIKKFCKGEGGTLFMGLLSVVYILTNKYTGQQDIIIGTPIAGREHSELGNQVGLYMNTLALRVRLHGKENLKEIFDQVRRVCLGAYEHQSYPFDQLIEELQLKRDVSRSALFDVMVVLQNATFHEQMFRQQEQLGLKVSKYDDDENVMSKFDITFTFKEVGEELHLNIEYNTDIYYRNTIERLTSHLVHLFEVLPRAADQTLDQTVLLSEKGKNLLLAQFNNTSHEYQHHRTLIDLFEAQAEGGANRIAVVFNEKCLSFAEINERSNQLADFFISKYEIGPDDIVALKLPRNEWLIPVILGVLKSGGAFMPIDPRYPRQRIAQMVDNSACKLIFDEDELKKFLACNDTYSKHNPARRAMPENLAYVMYTSGSSGELLGVQVEHRNLTSFFENLVTRFGLNGDNVFGAASNYIFDASVMELLGPLVKGMKLVLIPSIYHVTILEAIRTHCIDTLHTTSHQLDKLLREPDALSIFSGLKVLFIEGETLSTRSYTKLKALEHLHIFKVYGHTETTIWSTSLDLGNSNDLSLGRPLVNEQVYIINERNSQLCPIGVEGEICIGGDGVSRGYINRPELTAQKFMTSPFNSDRKLYRTGDRGHWTADGSIVFSGRKDHQVKFRGYKVELGEVENALRSYAGIEASVVLVNQNGDEQELVACVESQRPLPASELRAHLAKKLPVYMLPDRFVQVRSLPLNEYGKPDPKAIFHLIKKGDPIIGA
ncbi:MAG: amino acid adenylation domain-containing protein [Ginsengibacter sp.]